MGVLEEVAVHDPKFRAILAAGAVGFLMATGVRAVVDPGRAFAVGGVGPLGAGVATWWLYGDR